MDLIKLTLVVLISIFVKSASSFKTGLEPGLICYQCVGTHPGCTLYDFDWRWYWGVTCPRSDDRCVKIIERKGADVMVTRDCLSNVDSFRTDVPADKYDGCRTSTNDIQLGQYTFNTVKELDTKRKHYDNVTWCFCDFDHWCNHSARLQTDLTAALPILLIMVSLTGTLFHT